MRKPGSLDHCEDKEQRWLHHICGGSTEFCFEMKLCSSWMFAVHAFFLRLPVLVACWDVAMCWAPAAWFSALCFSLDHSCSIFIKSHGFPLPVLSPQDFLISACYFLQAVCSLAAIISLYLCVVLGILFTKCILSDYLCNLGSVGLGIPASQGEDQSPKTWNESVGLLESNFPCCVHAPCCVRVLCRFP